MIIEQNRSISLWGEVRRLKGSGRILEGSLKWSWDAFCLSWIVLGIPWSDLEASRGCLGISWGCLRASWGALVSPSPTAGLGIKLPLASFSHLFHTQTQLNFTQLNTTQLNSSHLTFGTSPGVILEPLGRPNRPKIGPNRLLRPYLFKNVNFHETSAGVLSGALPGPQDGTQNDPRSPQDGSKTIFKSFFFRLRFCHRFWSVLGYGPHLGRPLGLQMVPHSKWLGSKRH